MSETKNSSGGATPDLKDAALSEEALENVTGGEEGAFKDACTYCANQAGKCPFIDNIFTVLDTMEGRRACAYFTRG